VPNDPFYFTPQWKQLRRAALERDRYRCSVPGCSERATHVDHIKRRREGGADELGNLRSFCAAHDAQVKERPDGTRFNDGKPRPIGCGLDGWPAARG
jgi:5-methylcytosine-specific restriction endonuclease McrA